jgi:hypothetical protein
VAMEGVGLCIVGTGGVWGCFVGVPLLEGCLEKNAGRHDVGVPFAVAAVKVCECDGGAEGGRTDFPQSAHGMLRVCCCDAE